MNILERLWFKAKTGADIRELNNGNAVDEKVVRLGNYYFGIMFDAESGEPTGDFGWSEDPSIFHTPVREHYTARQERNK